ncbi:MAG: hypothetical protein KDG89_11365 [Geminicoccaceae bacterium]|nr:hypothetical protein [Geminicoccaceae bacterium]
MLFECELGDPNTQMHGRSGQAQQGVDIYGHRKNGHGRMVGVQCKGKDQTYGGKVSEAELGDEVEKAKTFEPPLAEFILVTTAPDDAVIQAAARRLTAENRAAGPDMEVHVWGWGELQGRIALYPEALRAFHPDVTPFTDELRAGQDRTYEEVAALRAETRVGFKAVLDEGRARDETVERNLRREIDDYRDLLRAGKARTALDRLLAFEGRWGGGISDRLRFRVLTNIGAARVELGEGVEAADDFIKAGTFDPDHPDGQANRALAWLLRGDRARARRAAEEALAKDPTNVGAACCLIQARVEDEGLDDPLSAVPEALRETAPVLRAAVWFHGRRGRDAWRALAVEGWALHLDDDDLAYTAATARFEALMPPGAGAGEALPPEGSWDELEGIAGRLRGIWQRARAREAPPDDVSLPFNLAQALRLTGRSGEAAAVLDEARRRHPDDAMLARLRASLHVDAGEDERAEALLAGHGDDPTMVIVRAEVLLDQAPGRAAALLDARDDAWFGKEASYARLLHARALLADGDPAGAERVARAAVAAWPDGILPRCALAIASQAVDREAAVDAANHAIGFVDAGTAFRERFILAETCHRLDLNDAAADLLHGRVDAGHDSPALRLLFKALLESDRRRAANDLLASLPERLKAERFYRAMAFRVALAGKDRDAALRAAEAYLEVCPDDLEIRLHWLDICAHEAARAFLAEPVERLEGSPPLRMWLAHRLRDHGFVERAHDLGYRVVLAHERNPRICMAFVGLMLGREKSEDHRLGAATVGPDTAFTIRNRLDETRTLVVEPDPTLRPHPDIIAPDHSLARMALGKEVGDQFTFGERPWAQDDWTIVEVKHKHLHRLHDLKENFHVRFPEAEGLRRIIIKKEDEKPFEEIEEALRERAEAAEETLKLYDGEGLPLRLVGRLLGVDPVEALAGMIQEGRAIRTCVGVEAERAAALAAIDANGRGGCFVDAMTLHTIHRLGVVEAVASVCGPLHVSQPTRDLFLARVERARAEQGRRRGTAAWREGRMVFCEDTPEQQAERLRRAEAVWDWVRANTTVVPAVGWEDLPENLRRVLRNADETILDDLLAAQGRGLLFLTDDMPVRQPAQTEAGLRASWLQPVLMAAVEQGRLGLRAYTKAVARMVGAGFEHTAVEEISLFEASSWPGEEPREGFFRLLADTLRGPKVDPLSAVGVVAGFVGLAWADGWPPLTRQARTGLLLEALCGGRDHEAVLEALMRRLPRLSQPFWVYLQGWLEGHFLAPRSTR